ncbi:RNA polymerase sigma factor [bacterium]|nr:RNA polymerase sigma factor [bacterium]MBU1652756.1 RNA polymerase sigma factor [bacterium]
MSSGWDLWEKARQGDQSAWRCLFRDYYPGLVRLTALLTGSKDAAEDVSQEAFYKLLKVPPRDRRGSIKGYLSTIAYRLALKERQRGLKNQSLTNLDVPAASPSALERAINDETQRQVVQALHSLDEKHRTIVILRFYAEQTYEEIAATTGIPLGTVKSRIFYAVKQCRETLQALGVHP